MIRLISITSMIFSFFSFSEIHIDGKTIRGSVGGGGANVQLSTHVEQLLFSNKASNHPEYVELSVRGKVYQSDAVVEGLPTVLPEKIRLLFRPENVRDKLTLEVCLAMAKESRAKKKPLVVHVFLTPPSHLLNSIEGGMAEMRFNSFVLKSDDPKITSISCEVSG